LTSEAKPELFGQVKNYISKVLKIKLKFEIAKIIAFVSKQDIHDCAGRGDVEGLKRILDARGADVDAKKSDFKISKASTLRKKIFKNFFPNKSASKP